MIVFAFAPVTFYFFFIWFFSLASKVESQWNQKDSLNCLSKKKKKKNNLRKQTVF